MIGKSIKHLFIKFFWTGIKKDNFNALRLICNAEGEKIEQLKYEKLVQFSEENFEWPEIEYQGYIVSFEGECRIVNKNDILYHLHLNCDAPTPFGVKPSYHFYKRKDQSIYY